MMRISVVVPGVVLVVVVTVCGPAEATTVLFGGANTQPTEG